MSQNIHQHTSIFSKIASSKQFSEAKTKVFIYLQLKYCSAHISVYVNTFYVLRIFLFMNISLDLGQVKMQAYVNKINNFTEYLPGFRKQ